MGRDRGHLDEPSWRVFQHDHHGDFDEADTVSAATAMEAAEKWAEQDDWSSADYTIIGGEEAVVLVWAAGSEPETGTWFRVTGESVPHYYARETNRR